MGQVITTVPSCLWGHTSQRYPELETQGFPGLHAIPSLEDLFLFRPDVIFPPLTPFTVVPLHPYIFMLTARKPCPLFLPLLSDLIYKEVYDWEECTKNGVIRGQPPPLGESSLGTRRTEKAVVWCPSHLILMYRDPSWDDTSDDGNGGNDVSSSSVQTVGDVEVMSAEVAHCLTQGADRCLLHDDER